MTVLTMNLFRLLLLFLFGSLLSLCEHSSLLKFPLFLGWFDRILVMFKLNFTIKLILVSQLIELFDMFLQLILLKVGSLYFVNDLRPILKSRHYFIFIMDFIDLFRVLRLFEELSNYTIKIILFTVSYILCLDLYLKDNYIKSIENLKFL